MTSLILEFGITLIAEMYPHLLPAALSEWWSKRKAIRETKKLQLTPLLVSPWTKNRSFD